MDVRAIVNFCSIECYLQMSGEKSVGNMFEAWLYAHRMSGHSLPGVDWVLSIGQLVEPKKNYFGFRTTGVQVGYDVKPNWETVPRQMVNLMEGQKNLTPGEFFKEFEEVHPFVDGNGRTGAILFNWLNGTLDNPDWPPNYFNDPRRVPGHGAPKKPWVPGHGAPKKP